MKAEDTIILALDCVAETAIPLATTVREAAGINFVKVGWELFLSGGMDLVAKLDAEDFNIFLDLKINDTPLTMERSLFRIPPYRGLRFVSIRGGVDTIRAAKKSMPTGASLVHVPVLSSDKLGWLWTNQVKEVVRPLVKECKTFVASGRQIGVLQNAFPGITIIGVGATRDPQFIPPDKDDPKRGHREVYPVEQLVAWGADYVVVGRPITEGGMEEWGQRAIDIVNRLK